MEATIRARGGTGRSASLRRWRVAALAVAGAATAALALGPAARGATIGSTDPGVTGCTAGVHCPPPIPYFAASGEANDLTVSRDAGSNATTFTEQGSVTINVASGSAGTCTNLSPHSVRCSPGDVGIDVELGDQADSATLSGPLGPNCGQSGFVGVCVQVNGGPGLDFLDASGVTGDGVFGHGLTLLGGDGSDTLRGGAGGDLLVGGAGGDTISGGPGQDLASYSDHSTGVVANLDGARNDGTPGTDGGTTVGADQIDTDVEQLQGGKGNDTLSGNDGANRIIGGAGSDVLKGLGGGDFLDANDGIPDTVLCGAGTDKASVDLKDGPAGFSDCEGVSQAAVDQHPTVVIRSRSLQLGNGHGGHASTAVKLKCPAALAQGCQGGLAISELGGSGKARKVIGRSRYRKVAAGSSARVTVPIKDAAVRAARRKGHLTVRVDASGLDANGMPKDTLMTLRLNA